MMMEKILLFKFGLLFIVMALLFSSCEQNPNLLLLNDKCHEDSTTYCHYFVVEHDTDEVDLTFSVANVSDDFNYSVNVI